MNLFLILPQSISVPLMLNCEQSKWPNLGDYLEHVLFEPSEEAEELRGTCIMLGKTVKFTPINDSVLISNSDRVYVLSRYYPIVKQTYDGRSVSLAPSNDWILPPI